MYLITNKAEDVLKGAFHISVAFTIATLCNVNALEICPFTLWQERTQEFRKDQRDPECAAWHNVMPTGTTMVCIGGKTCRRGRLKLYPILPCCPLLLDRLRIIHG